MPATRKKLPFEVWALVAGGFTVALGYGVVAPAIPQFAKEFEVSNLAASAIVSAFALMRLLSAPLAGWLVSKFGERRIYTTGILIVALSTGACALAATYPQLIVLRGLGGIGSAMFSIAATALLVKVSPVEERGRVASVNSAGFLLGGLLGPVFGALVAGFGIRAPFVFYFLTLVAAATIVSIALRGSQVAGVSGLRPASDAPPIHLREAIRFPEFRALLFSVFSFGWSSFGVRVSIVPLFVAAVLGGNASVAAWVLAAYAAGNAALIFPAGQWTDRFGRKPLLITGMAIMTAGYLAFPASPSIGLAMACMFVAGLGSALANPAQQAVLADVVGRRPGGTVVAAYSMSSDLGGVLGPLIAGAIVDLAGFGWAFSATAALLVVALTFWATAPDSRRRAARSAEATTEPERT